MIRNCLFRTVTRLNIVYDVHDKVTDILIFVILTGLFGENAPNETFVFVDWNLKHI